MHAFFACALCRDRCCLLCWTTRPQGAVLVASSPSSPSCSSCGCCAASFFVAMNVVGSFLVVGSCGFSFGASLGRFRPIKYHASTACIFCFSARPAQAGALSSQQCICLARVGGAVAETLHYTQGGLWAPKPTLLFLRRVRHGDDTGKLPS